LLPVVVADADHLLAAQLDGKTGFVLSLIDGVTTVESILDLSGMPAEETLGILKDLRARGIVVMRQGLEES
jgi:CRP-like cAMP-binding protein